MVAEVCALASVPAIVALMASAAKRVLLYWWAYHVALDIQFWSCFGVERCRETTPANSGVESATLGKLKTECKVWTALEINQYFIGLICFFLLCYVSCRLLLQSEAYRSWSFTPWLIWESRSAVVFTRYPYRGSYTQRLRLALRQCHEFRLTIRGYKALKPAP